MRHATLLTHTSVSQRTLPTFLCSWPDDIVLVTSALLVRLILTDVVRPVVSAPWLPARSVCVFGLCPQGKAIWPEICACGVTQLWPVRIHQSHNVSGRGAVTVRT